MCEEDFIEEEHAGEGVSDMEDMVRSTYGEETAAM